MPNQPNHALDEAARAYWNIQAAQFDQEPDHGLRDAATRAAWRDLLQAWLPPAPATVLDVGCGTGSLSVLMAHLGYRVHASDFAPAMLTQARRKAISAEIDLPLAVMDAFQPALAARTYHAIVCRHLLWALPDSAEALRRWATLLQPGGKLLLIEGFWHTGGGLHAAQITSTLPNALNQVALVNLAPHAQLWGQPVNDERYLLVAERVDVSKLGRENAISKN